MTVLGVYWAPGHQRPTDIDYMQRLQPPAIRVLDPDVNQISIAHRTAPNALILPRDWALSEQHDDVRRDPVGTGKRHAQDWHNKLARWRATGLQLPPDNQIVVVGINEPQVWNMLQQTVDYNVAFLDECTRLHLRACALNLSVGWPANNGPDTPPDWTPYAPIEAAIKRGNHFLVLHEYWYRTGPRDGWGWFAGRLQHCPWDVPIIIGECGIDMYVDMQRWENDGKPNRGWRGNVEPERYAVQMEEYARSIDKRVVAILPFLTDYRSNNWESFDTAEAHEQFLARKDSMVPQGKAHTIHLPSIEAPAPAEPDVIPLNAHVVTRKPSNIRSAPTFEDNVIEVAPIGTPYVVTGDAGEFYEIEYSGGKAYVHESVVSRTDVEPQPVGDKWERSYAYVRRWEGGEVDDPNDKGGATNKGITLGTYTRWRKDRGQPEPTKADLWAITDAEVKQIYHEWYWLESGADKLAWPLCLAQFDTAINAGPGKANEMLAKSNGNFMAYVGHVGIWYTTLQDFQHFGRAWSRRRFELLLEASK